jgi:hypothetical protein
MRVLVTVNNEERNPWTFIASLSLSTELLSVYSQFRSALSTGGNPFKEHNIVSV